MALKRLYFSKFLWEACPRTPLEVLAPSARVEQIRVRPPPQKCLSPYAHVSNHFNFTKSLSIFSFYTLKGNQVTKFNREIYLIFFISVLLRETFSTKSMKCLSAILNKFLNPLTMF